MISLVCISMESPFSSKQTVQVNFSCVKYIITIDPDFVFVKIVHGYVVCLFIIAKQRHSKFKVC